MISRLDSALTELALRLRQLDGLVAVVLFGSYARGDFGQKSDVDLLILFEGDARPEEGETGQTALRLVAQMETAHRLPMHLAPLLASADKPQTLGNDLLHDLWAEGVVLFAEAGALTPLRPEGLAPYALVRFSLAGASPSEKVRLSRRLHGRQGRGGVLGPASQVLGPGVLLLPAMHLASVRTVLDEAGASYDVIDIWR